MAVAPPRDTLDELAELLRASSAPPVAPPAVERERPTLDITASTAAEAAGTNSPAFNAWQTRRAVDATVGPHCADPVAAGRETIDALRDIGPANAREGMLAALLVASFDAAAESFAMAQKAVGPEREWHLGAAAKLARAHASVSEALDRTRARVGERLIVVEHCSASSAALR
jgi:hypothetical protein